MEHSPDILEQLRIYKLMTLIIFYILFCVHFNVGRTLRIRDETRTSNESKKQEAGLVHQEIFSFIVCICFFPLSGSEDKEESMSKISKCP